MVVAIAAGATVLADISALITFSVQYASCLQQIDSGDTLTDPLCVTADLKKIGGYHIGICGILTIGAFLNLYVPIMMARLVDHPGYQDLSSNAMGTGSEENFLNNRRLVNASLLSRALTILTGCAAFLALEVSILTSTSDIKYLWFCHALMIVPAILTGFPMFLTNDRINKIAAISALVALVGSTVGLGLISWYFSWLCEVDPPKTGFSNFTTCEIGRTGAIYFVALHALFTGIGMVRALVCLYVLRISASASYSDPETSEVIARQNLVSSGNSDVSAYGTAYRRIQTPHGEAVEINSKVSGGKLKV